MSFLCKIRGQAKQRFRVCFIILLPLVLTACATAVTRLYSGSQKPQTETSLLKQTGKVYGKFPVLVSVDGQIGTDVLQVGGEWQKCYNSRWNCGFQIELLPGSHTIEVRYLSAGYNQQTYSADSKTITFNAEAGKVYTIKINAEEEKGAWSADVILLEDHK